MWWLPSLGCDTAGSSVGGSFGGGWATYVHTYGTFSEEARLIQAHTSCHRMLIQASLTHHCTASGQLQITWLLMDAQGDVHKMPSSHSVH